MRNPANGIRCLTAQRPLRACGSRTANESCLIRNEGSHHSPAPEGALYFQPANSIRWVNCVEWPQSANGIRRLTAQRPLRACGSRTANESCLMRNKGLHHSPAPEGALYFQPANSIRWVNCVEWPQSANGIRRLTAQRPLRACGSRTANESCLIRNEGSHHSPAPEGALYFQPANSIRWVNCVEWPQSANGIRRLTAQRPLRACGSRTANESCLIR